jgi:hypothetical protein
MVQSAIRRRFWRGYWYSHTLLHRVIHRLLCGYSALALVVVDKKSSVVKIRQIEALGSGKQIGSSDRIIVGRFGEGGGPPCSFTFCVGSLGKHCADSDVILQRARELGECDFNFARRHEFRTLPPGSSSVGNVTSQASVASASLSLFNSSRVASRLCSRSRIRSSCSTRARDCNFRICFWSLAMLKSRKSSWACRLF